jgi:hypothetical protein
VVLTYARSRFKNEKEWDEGYERYRRARSIAFNVEQRSLLHNTTFEILVTRLAPTALYTAEQYSLSDKSGNVVSIGTCSIAFALSFFDSPEYSAFFEARIRRRIFASPLAARKLSQMLWTPNTAAYCHKGRKTPPDFEQKASQVIRSCLFKIAVEQHDCMGVWKPRSKKANISSIDVVQGDSTIPRARYDEDVVSFYKVAKASPFPSQSFLAYYPRTRVFLPACRRDKAPRPSCVTPEPAQPSSGSHYTRQINLFGARAGFSNDETEMLRGVLDRYMPEQDLINFIVDVEAKLGEKVYSKRRKLFGEDVQVSLVEGHAIANAAKVLKHIRNAIVHSSDKYKREDCHIPLSETEDLIDEFIPLIRFLSERVVYGSAT